MLEYTVQLDSGRSLRVAETGAPTGLPVFSLHGTPGSRLNYELFSADAARQDLRLLSFDRPGYGDSTPVPGRRIVDEARHVEAIADHAGIERFAVWGMSGGGAPALACAARMPARVVAAASLAGVAPYPAEGLDWSAGMGQANLEDFELMLRDQRAWEQKSRKDREEMLAATPEQLRAMLETLLSDVDRGAFTDSLATFLIAQAREGLKHGDEGVRDDNLSGVQPWGFDLGAIRVPVQIWHGDQDRFVPFSHGKWLAAHVPGADAHLEAGQGHLSLITSRVPDVHRWFHQKF